MWRSPMKNLPRAWRNVIVLAGVFALGVLFDRYAIPFLSRDVGVWVIQGVEGRGCEGSWGATLIRFGKPSGQSDGVYKIPCGEISPASDTAALLCKCR